MNITSLWVDYPALLSFSLKLFFIGQFSYWLHCYPELYFQRVKKEDITQRIIYTTIGLFFTFTAYFLKYDNFIISFRYLNILLILLIFYYYYYSFQQVSIILFILHYTGDILLHTARINHFINQKENITRSEFHKSFTFYMHIISLIENYIIKFFTVLFLIANSVYVFVRIASIMLTILVFLYGFNQIESSFDYSTGNFNIPIVQYTVLSVIVFFQIYLLHTFIMRQIKRARENTTPVVTKVKPKQKLKKKEGKSEYKISEDISV